MSPSRGVLAGDEWVSALGHEGSFQVGSIRNERACTDSSPLPSLLGSGGLARDGMRFESAADIAVSAQFRRRHHPNYSRGTLYRHSSRTCRIGGGGSAIRRHPPASRRSGKPARFAGAGPARRIPAGGNDAAIARLRASRCTVDAALLSSRAGDRRRSRLPTPVRARAEHSGASLAERRIHASSGAALGHPRGRSGHGPFEWAKLAARTEVQRSHLSLHEAMQAYRSSRSDADFGRAMQCFETMPAHQLDGWKVARLTQRRYWEIDDRIRVARCGARARERSDYWPVKLGDFWSEYVVVDN